MHSIVGNIISLIPAVEPVKAQLYQIIDESFIFKKYCWYNEIFKLHLAVLQEKKSEGPCSRMLFAINFGDYFLSVTDNFHMPHRGHLCYAPSRHN